MKKLITIVLTISMIAALFVLPSAAITEAEATSWKYTMLMQSLKGLCFTADNMVTFSSYTMRGMAVSQDGKYLFGGMLHPNGAGSIEMFDAATGKVLSGIQYDQGDGQFSFPKGLATDDRGYVYAALAYQPNNTRAKIGIYEYPGNQLKLVKDIDIITTNADTKTGVNGITVEKINGSYYAYVVVNYDVDYLIKVNVTDPANPALDTSFGVEGRINLQEAPYSVKDANYLDVDTDGTIYLSADTGSKKLLIISADGKNVVNTIDFGSDKAYGVALYKDYVFISMQNTGKFSIYDKVTLAPVANITVGMDNIVLPIDRDEILINGGISSMCNITICNDILFLGDQGGSSAMDQILAVGLTPDAAKIVESYAKGIHDSLSAIYPEATDAPATTEAPATDAPATTEAPDTDAPATTEAPTTDAPATQAPTTDAPDTDPAPSKGCGGMIAGSAIVLALIATAFVLKKRD